MWNLQGLKVVLAGVGASEAPGASETPVASEAYMEPLDAAETKI